MPFDKLKDKIKKAASHQRVHDRTSEALAKAHNQKKKKRTVSGGRVSVQIDE